MNPNPKPKPTPTIEKPIITPQGTEGSEWDDYAWTADDF